MHFVILYYSLILLAKMEEVDRLEDDYMNIKVEEHPIKVEFNQELEAPRYDYLDIKEEHLIQVELK